jgi:hypothetical protein
MNKSIETAMEKTLDLDAIGTIAIRRGRHLPNRRNGGFFGDLDVCSAKISFEILDPLVPAGTTFSFTLGFFVRDNDQAPAFPRGKLRFRSEKPAGTRVEIATRRHDGALIELVAGVEPGKKSRRDDEKGKRLLRSAIARLWFSPPLVECVLHRMSSSNGLRGGRVVTTGIPLDASSEDEAMDALLVARKLLVENPENIGAGLDGMERSLLRAHLCLLPPLPEKRKAKPEIRGWMLCDGGALFAHSQASDWISEAFVKAGISRRRCEPALGWGCLLLPEAIRETPERIETLAAFDLDEESERKRKLVDRSIGERLVSVGGDDLSAHERIDAIAQGDAAAERLKTRPRRF